jgi:hypothetical protein
MGSPSPLQPGALPLRTPAAWRTRVVAGLRRDVAPLETHWSPSICQAQGSFLSNSCPSSVSSRSISSSSGASFHSSSTSSPLGGHANRRLSRQCLESHHGTRGLATAAAARWLRGPGSSAAGGGGRWGGVNAISGGGGALRFQQLRGLLGKPSLAPKKVITSDCHNILRSPRARAPAHGVRRCTLRCGPHRPPCAPPAAAARRAQLAARPPHSAPHGATRSHRSGRDLPPRSPSPISSTAWRAPTTRLDLF